MPAPTCVRGLQARVVLAVRATDIAGPPGESPVYGGTAQPLCGPLTAKGQGHSERPSAALWLPLAKPVRANAFRLPDLRSIVSTLSRTTGPMNPSQPAG